MLTNIRSCVMMKIQKNKQMFAKVGENIAFLLYGMYNIGKETLWGKKMIYSGIWDFVQRWNWSLESTQTGWNFTGNIR